MKPRIQWGAGFVNTLDFDNHMSDEYTYPQPKAQYKRARSYATSTVNDVWNYGFDYMAQFTLRYIPTAQWDGPTGVKMFIAQAMRGRPFRFYPDRENAPGVYYNVVLMSPEMEQYGSYEVDGSKSVSLTVRTIDDTYIPGF